MRVRELIELLKTYPYDYSIVPLPDECGATARLTREGQARLAFIHGGVCCWILEGGENDDDEVTENTALQQLANRDAQKSTDP